MCPAECSPYDGFTAHPDSDHVGDNLYQNYTVDRAATVCSYEPSCSGFNSDGRRKSYWSGLTPVPAPGKCLWIKNRECLVVSSSSSWWRAALAVGACTGLSWCMYGAWPRPTTLSVELPPRGQQELVGEARSCGALLLRR